jgi:hypothetical protein
MSEPSPALPGRPAGARAPLSAPVVASPQPICPVCRAPRDTRQWMSACSAGCRAELSRRRKAEGQRSRDAETLAVLDGIERLCGLLKKRLEAT